MHKQHVVAPCTRIPISPDSVRYSFNSTQIKGWLWLLEHVFMYNYFQLPQEHHRTFRVMVLLIEPLYTKLLKHSRKPFKGKKHFVIPQSIAEGFMLGYEKGYFIAVLANAEELTVCYCDSLLCGLYEYLGKYYQTI